MSSSSKFMASPFGHVPVMSQAAIDLLACSSGKVAVDATVGGGGHAELILKHVGKTGHLVGIDWDQEAIERTRKRLGTRPNLTLVRDNFRNLASILARLKLERIDALLLDLGLSSFQVDEGSRGFSFRLEGPLDMRMDKRSKTKALDIVNEYPEKDMAGIIRNLGEETNASRIAKAIVRERKKRAILTTAELAEIIRRVVPKKRRPIKIDPATRTFQALRIEVNMELENLKTVLNDGIPLLQPGGRICVISFHSLEDRIVKTIFNRAARGCVCPPEIPRCVCDKKPELRILTSKPVRPSGEEVESNPRSRSAKLRAAERIA